jgi:hypothetical protein
MMRIKSSKPPPIYMLVPPFESYLPGYPFTEVTTLAPRHLIGFEELALGSSDLWLTHHP